MVTELPIDELESRVSRLREELAEGEVGTTFSDLFPPGWMDYHTDTTDFGTFLEESPWDVECAEDFEAIPATEWEVYIADHTDFQTWEEMVEQAANDYVRRRLTVAGAGR